ncbi:MAG: FlgD immunoglobulin-like domain containing protein, partial [bacterium]
MRKIIYTLAVLAAGISLTCMFPVPGRSLVLYATNSACDCLYIVDLISGDTTYVGDLGAPGQFKTPTSMAVDLDGTLFTVNNSTGELLTIDKFTGAATVVGSGTGQQDGLAIAPVDVLGPGGITLPKGTLFGSTSVLATIDKTTGDTTIIGPIGRRIAGLAFRSDGTLFGAELSLGTDTLVTINTQTGAGTVVGEIGPNFDRIGALVFTIGDALLGSDINTSDLKIFEIDQTSGTISNEVSVASAPQGMGFASAVNCTTFDDLENTIGDAVIDNNGVRNSLQVKANNARKQFDRGKLKTSGNVLCALLHHVDAQNGKHIDSASAQDIRDCVTTLAGNLGIPLPCESEAAVLLTLPRNFPNPFRSATTIEYRVGDVEAGSQNQMSPKANSQILAAGDRNRVVLRIYDLTGREVRSLVDREQEPGYYIVEWDGRNSEGRKVPGGIYFYRLSTGNETL